MQGFLLMSYKGISHKTVQICACSLNKFCYYFFEYSIMDKAVMEPQKQERYVRWQDHRIAHMSFAINLFLGFAVASLVYAINLKIENKPHGSVPLETTIIWWAASAAFGCIAIMSKLLDYRYTARKIKDGGSFNALMTKFCGPVTWGSFWLQVIAYVVGATIFIIGVINA